MEVPGLTNMRTTGQTEPMVLMAQRRMAPMEEQARMGRKNHRMGWLGKMVLMPPLPMGAGEVVARTHRQDVGGPASPVEMGEMGAHLRFWR